MRITRYAIISVFTVLSLLSCNKTEVEDHGYGYLYVSLDRDSGEDIVFKSAPVEDMVFSLAVYNSLGQKVGFVEDYRSLGDSPMVLPAGNYSYTATASSGENGAAAFDEPFYSGSTEFKVSKDQVSNIDITCALANIKVTAVFSDEVKNSFKRYVLTVSNGEGELVFDNTAEPSTIDKEGFFSATGTLTWSLLLENNDGQVYEELTDTYTDVKARQHYNLSFSLKQPDPAGGGAVTVVVDDSMTEKEYDLTLDFGEKEAPEISADFDISLPVTVTAGDVTSRVFHLTAENGFKSIVLDYGSASSTGTAAIKYEIVDAESGVLEELASDGISVDPVAAGDKSADIDVTSYITNLPIGKYVINIFAVDNNNVYVEKAVDLTVMSPVDIEAVSANAWARFAVVKAKWFPTTRPDGLSFQYRKASESGWTDFTGTVTTNDANRTYSAEIRGLEAETRYVFRAVSSTETETKELSFTTEAEQTLHNMGFDFWWTDGKAPMPNESASYHIWDTANPGSASFTIIPTNSESDHVAVSGENKNAAKLVTLSAPIVGLAAGNIYTGDFIGTVGSPFPKGAELDWGVPFTSRPLALSGYYDYRPETVNKGSHADMNGKTDICQIQVILTDWSVPFRINTMNGDFVDIQNDPSIIAYGVFEDSRTMSDYEKFTIELDYRDTERTPKYIVVVASASKYGDYFTGGVGSTLYLDEFEFVYDPDQL